MARKQHEEQAVKRYLLKQLSDAERQEIELRLLCNGNSAIRCLAEPLREDADGILRRSERRFGHCRWRERYVGQGHAGHIHSRVSLDVVVRGLVGYLLPLEFTVVEACNGDRSIAFLLGDRVIVLSFLATSLPTLTRVFFLGTLKTRS